MREPKRSKKGPGRKYNSLQEARRNFTQWLDEEVGLEGNWMREHELGLRFRIELYLAKCKSLNWTEDLLEKERARLEEYIEYLEGDGKHWLANL